VGLVRELKESVCKRVSEAVSGIQDEEMDSILRGLRSLHSALRKEARG
jgi:hypothetical protein